MDIDLYEELNCVPPLRSKHLDYNSRVLSFYTHKWLKQVSPAALAASGFTFTGVKDKVMCVYCKIVLERWQPEDNPDADHLRESPHCVFVRWKQLPAIKALYDEGYEEEVIVRACDSFMKEVKADDLRKRLNKEQVSIRSDPLCKICLEKNSNVLLLPCRHLVSCTDCAHRLTDCCVCRQKIVHFFPVFT